MKIVIFATESFIIDRFIIEIFVVEAPGGTPGAFLKSFPFILVGQANDLIVYHPVSGQLPLRPKSLSYKSDTVPQHNRNDIQRYFIQQGRFNQRGYKLTAANDLNIRFRT